MASPAGIEIKPFDTVYLFGGTSLMNAVGDRLREMGLTVYLFTSPRQEADVKGALVLEDINTGCWTAKIERGIGIGIGEAWQFGPEIRQAFGDNLIDFMSIPYPRYLGGAHVTHALMRGEHTWGCCMQQVTENTKPGEIHDGGVIESWDFPFDPERHERRYAEFIVGFVQRARGGLDLQFIDDDVTPMFLPRLNTAKQAWIDWRWARNDIVRFIRAFDKPYPGARTLCDESVITLHEVNDNGCTDATFHPFQLGLVIAVGNGAIEIVTRTGTIMAKPGYGDHPSFVIKPGMRLFTPQAQLEAAMLYTPHYTPTGDANA